jgi:lipid-binding SYLF domain-containing protein
MAFFSRKPKPVSQPITIKSGGGSGSGGGVGGVGGAGAALEPRIFEIGSDLLARARGIIILHKFKAGLIVGGEAGNGIALVRDKTTGAWSAPAFISSAEGSYGLQIGAQESTIVLLLMNETGLKPLLGGSVNIGVDVAATAGPFDEGGKIDTTTIQQPILVYSSSGGLFAGAAFKGGGILPEQKSNEMFYARGMNDILFDHAVRPNATGQHLIDVLETYAGRRTN